MQGLDLRRTPDSDIWLTPFIHSGQCRRPHSYKWDNLPCDPAFVAPRESCWLYLRYVNTDDGLLQVREIRNLRFNASLVTLSACNTGVGPVGEEGAANIVNAFIEAGAQSVVSTLWELEDHATAQLMTNFYANLSHNQEKAEALRQAQVEMLNSGAPPYYWAGLVLDGEPNGNLFRKPKLNSLLGAPDDSEFRRQLDITSPDLDARSKSHSQ